MFAIGTKPQTLIGIMDCSENERVNTNHLGRTDLQTAVFFINILSFRRTEKIFSVPSEPGKFSEGTEKVSEGTEKISTFSIFSQPVILPDGLCILERYCMNL